MFHSLRARLWLSYAVLIITALAVVGTVLVLFLVRNPVLYRNTFVRLTAAEAVLSSQATPADQLEEVSRAFGVRALLFASNGRLIRDSGGNQSAIGLPSNPLKLSSTGLERDFSGKVWFYSVKRLSDGDWEQVPRGRLPPPGRKESLPHYNGSGTPDRSRCPGLDDPTPQSTSTASH